MRIAIVSDGIWVYGGAERVLECLLRLYPDADLFALVDLLPEGSRAWLGGRAIRTSFLQKLPCTGLYFRKLLSLWPVAIEQFDLTQYDLVISSQFAVAHGAITGPFASPCLLYPLTNALCLGFAGTISSRGKPASGTANASRPSHAASFTPMGPGGSVARRQLQRELRVRSRADQEILPSQQYRNISSCFLDRFTFRETKDDYFLYLGRLVAYKRVDLIIDAFAAMPDRKLIIAGDGPLLKSLRARATPNVHVLGAVDAARADALMGGARAYIYAAVEDFGIAPVEAQATGTPVIGLGIGGLRETVRDSADRAPTGLFFMQQSVEALSEAVEAFERVRSQIDPTDCHANARRFAPERFLDRFGTFVDRALREQALAPVQHDGESSAVPLPVAAE